MGMKITFEADDLEELNAAILAYMTAAGQLAEEDEAEEETKKGKDKKAAADDDDDLGLGDDDAAEAESEVDDSEADAKREKLKGTVVKLSKKTGGPDILKTALKTVKCAKFADVPNAKLDAFTAALKKAIAAAKE